jgi:hypothetical protein
MTKVLLALAILSSGVGGFVTARHSTIRLAHETNAHRDAWLLQTQRFVAVQREQADLAERIRDLKESLAQSRPVAENALWAALQTNRADNLPSELRERVLDELGFNWRLSPDFIVVTKQTVDRSGAWMLLNGKLPLTAAVLALTPEERRPIEAVMERAKADFKDWALARAERSEPKGNDVAIYFLPVDPGSVHSLSNNVAAGVFAAALGRERTEMMRRSVRNWIETDIGIGAKGERFTITRETAGNTQRLRATLGWPYDEVFRSGYIPEFDFPGPFRPIFPDGWTDVAKREGFELPQELQKE